MAKQQKQKKTEVKPISAIPFQSSFALFGILAITFIVFYRCIYHSFVHYDDLQYITSNELIRKLDAKSISRIFSTPVIGMYNPLPMLVYAIEYKLWGLNPKYFHLVNLLSHILATVCIYRFFLRLSGDKITTLIVTFLFALHPLHTSVVMWASQLKTSMFVIFYMIALVCYLNYRKNGSGQQIMLCGLYFLLALLSKPTAVSMPLMLVLIDYYLDKRITLKSLLAKSPFFLLSLIFGIITILTHRAFDDDIFHTTHAYSLLNKILVMNYSVVFYLEKLFIPLHLSTIYPYPANDTWLPLNYYLTLPVIPLLAWFIYKSGRYRHDILFGLAFFLIALFPVLRLIPAGDFGMANRYSYLSYSGLFYILGRFYSDLSLGKLNSPFIKTRQHIHLIFLAFGVFLIWHTYDRTKVWENSYTLFSDVIKKYPHYPKAYNQRGLAHYSFGNLDSALKDISTAIKLKPDFGEGYNNRAAILMEAGRFTEAENDLMTAISINYRDASAYNNLGKCLIREGKIEQALSIYSQAIEFNPKLREAYLNRAMILLVKGDSSGAYQDAKTAEKLGMKEATKFIKMKFPDGTHP